MSTNNTLTAKANEGEGTDALATLDLGAQGKAGQCGCDQTKGNQNVIK